MEPRPLTSAMESPTFEEDSSFHVEQPVGSMSIPTDRVQRMATTGHQLPPMVCDGGGIAAENMASPSHTMGGS
jgi:hypothetical protein